MILAHMIAYCGYVNGKMIINGKSTILGHLGLVLMNRFDHGLMVIHNRCIGSLYRQKL